MKQEPRTYAEFLAVCKAGQRDYIRSERVRFDALWKAWIAYRDAAHALGLHALDRSEITARFDQLNFMEARIDETHGDNPTQRALWNMHRHETAT